MDHYKEKCFLNTTSKIEGDNFAFLCMMKLLPLESKIIFVILIHQH